MATTTLDPRAGTVRRSWVIDWLTTVDHKKIGILYILNSFLFFFAAGILALVIRTELAVPGMQFLDQNTYNQAFTMHGTIMLFLFIIPALSGFGNYIVPLQLGAPDMAFPRINALSFWLLPLGGGLIFSGYLFGGAAAEGWTAYSPLTSDQYSPGVGTDLWVIGLTLVGTASILGAVNFIATIFKMRAPGMTLFRMPIFVWTVLVTAVLILLATPVLTAGPHRAVHRPQLRRLVLRSQRRRQPGPVAAHLLVLRPPRGLHRHPSGDGRRERDPARSSAASRCSATGRSCSQLLASACSASASGRTTCSPPVRCSCPSSAS